jgi:uncharacterized protein (DUF2141 family)
MAFRAFIIIGVLFLIQSCAQVGELSGGMKDEIAPIPNQEKMNPANGSTNFLGSTITIPFLEFIKLNQPSETMIMVPPHAKPVAKLKGKVVTVSWPESLHENTTYSVYFNGTFKDITEGNDSLMQFVFSTGNFIDSLKYQVKVIDAFTNQPIGNCLVGLYEGKTDSVRPTYFVKTSTDGIAKLKNLKEGNYTVLAFVDQNKDMLLQADERLAFRKEVISVVPAMLDSNSMLNDTVPLRLYSPPLKPNLRSISFKAPSQFFVGSTYPIQFSELSVNEKLLDKNTVEFYAADSLSFIYNLGDSADVSFSTLSDVFIDTISLHLLKREKEGKLSFSHNLKDNLMLPKDTLMFSFSDMISSIDSAKFQLFNMEDTTIVPINQLVFSKNKVSVLFKKDKLKSLKLLVAPNSVKTISSIYKDSLIIPFELKSDRDFGTLKLDVSEYKEAIVVEVLFGGKVVRTLSLSDKKSILLDYLNPGDYTFRIINDANKNGKWDIGDRNRGTLPEFVYYFSEVTKVRANWDIDLKLTPKL